ncbi:MAG: hypothetical protein AAGI91_11885 [Bacteroidota bacterium]
MTDEPAKNVWTELGSFLWKNRDWLVGQVGKIREWLSRPQKDAEGVERGVLIIGPGGVGKSTTARLLSGDHDTLLDTQTEYLESLGVERVPLADDENVELVIPPGQRHRRDSTWSDLEAGIAGGEYRGIVVLTAYGYHSLGNSYKENRLYTGDESEFMSQYLESSRADEVSVYKRLAPFIKSCDKKIWLLSLVTKQDLWSDRSREVVHFYEEGPIGEIVVDISSALGGKMFRHEMTPVSLVIYNFTTGKGEVLAPTVAGYDQAAQAHSLQRFWETLIALKDWEA